MKIKSGRCCFNDRVKNESTKPSVKHVTFTFIREHTAELSRCVRVAENEDEITQILKPLAQDFQKFNLHKNTCINV